MASGSFSPQLTPFPTSSLLVKEVPFAYTQLESLLRQLRVSGKEPQEGQQQVFYTAGELEEQLSTSLTQLKLTPADFTSAISFIHKVTNQTVGMILHSPSPPPLSLPSDGPDIRPPLS